MAEDAFYRRPRAGDRCLEAGRSGYRLPARRVAGARAQRRGATV